MELVEKGVFILLGGEVFNGKGWFYLVIILENIKLGMFVYDDELFGFVVLFIKVENDVEVM